MKIKSLILGTLATLILVISCDNNVSDNTDNTNGDSNGIIELQDIFFTHSDYNATNPAFTYSYDDSLYLVTFERNNYHLPYCPIWIYSETTGDKELYLASYHQHIIPEYSTYRLSLLPSTTNGNMRFDGILNIYASGDSITAYFFSQTQQILKFVGATIEGG